MGDEGIEGERTAGQHGLKIPELWSASTGRSLSNHGGHPHYLGDPKTWEPDDGNRSPYGSPWNELSLSDQIATTKYRFCLPVFSRLPRCPQMTYPIRQLFTPAQRVRMAEGGDQHVNE